MASPASRLRHLSRILRGERLVTSAVRRSLDVLLASAATALRSAGYDTAVLDARLPGWREALSTEVGPAVLSVFTEAWEATAGSTLIDPEPYATRHLEAVWNRLSGVPDTVFDTMRLTIEEGRRNQESIPDLAARVDLLLSDDQRWTNRAVTIARTETLGANNAGATASAGATAEVLGVNPAEVIKEWMATSDGRTRETHVEADGQQVMGLDALFSVGGADLQQPGDPSGPGEEVINCRCTVVFIYPGDPDYPTSLSPGNTGATARYPGTPPGSTADAEQAGRTALAPAADVPAVAMAREPVVDPGPSTAAESLARGLTIQELQAEASRGTATTKKAARAELRRRGVAASGAPVARFSTRNEGTMNTRLTAAVGADHEDDTTVWVALLPTADDPVNGIGPEDPKHATLLFLGEAATLPAEAEASLKDALAAYAADAGVITSAVSGVESLGDEGARVWMLTGDAVPTFREGLLTDEVNGYLTNGEQYPSYTPHVTIGYPLDPDEATEDETQPEPPETDVAPALDDATEQAAAEVESITFDRLALWWAGTETTWDLGQGEAPADVEAALTLVRDAGYTVALSAYAEDDTEVQPVPVEQPPAAASEIAPDGDPFYGIMWPEGVVSGDGRAIEAGATTWRDLPLPCMAQDATMPGHDGAVRTGRIDVMERDETTYSVPVIRYAGVWDTSPAAAETSRQVDNGVVRGISTDGDAVTVELRGSDGQVLDPMSDDFPEDGIVLEVATAARISGGTVCSVPAFHQAYIANGRLEDRTDPEPGWNADGTPKDNTLDGGAPVEDDEALPLVASVAGGPARRAPVWSLVAGASVLPVVDGHYFANPGLTEPTPLTVDDDGRVYGHLATWGTCHIGIDGYCQEPPVSASNYAYFAKGAVLTDTGERVRVGPLTMGTGHANMQYGYRAAAEHYDNTGTVVADITMGQDAVGIWFSGRIRPEASEAQVYALAAAGAVSGDWREVVRHSGDLELVAALVVNTPGFAMPRPAVAASAADGLALVAAGMVPPRHQDPVDATGLMTFTAIADAVVAHLDRREKARIAASRLDTRRAVRRAERVTAARSRLSERV